MGSFPGDECIKTTVLGIADGLTRDGLVLRYRVRNRQGLTLEPDWEPTTTGMRLRQAMSGHFRSGSTAHQTTPGDGRRRYGLPPKQ